MGPPGLPPGLPPELASLPPEILQQVLQLLQQGIPLEQAVSLEESRVPMGFLGEPEDVANLVVFLASVKARYITGTTIQVDGGSTVAVF